MLLRETFNCARKEGRERTRKIRGEGEKRRNEKKRKGVIKEGEEEAKELGDEERKK